MAGGNDGMVAERRAMFSRVMRIAFWAVLAHMTVLLLLAVVFA